MEKDILKQKLEEKKTQLKLICNDAHFADTLISDIISLKGQIEHEPTIVHVAESDVVKEFKGDTFEMRITNTGQAIYHVYGGYTIIADPRMSGIYDTINEFICADEKQDEYTDEEKELIRCDREVSAWVLSAPMYAFSDIDLKYKLATDIVEWITSFTEDINNPELQADDMRENINFEQSVKSVNELSDLVEMAGMNI